MKNVLSIIYGVVAFILLNAVTKVILLALFPMKDGLTMTNKEHMILYTAELPISAFIISLFAAFLSIFCACFITTKLSFREKRKSALATLLISIFFGISILTAFPQPWWLVIGSLGLYVLGGYFAYKLAG